MSKPALATLLVLKPKGSAPSEAPARPKRARVQAALRAAFKAAKDGKEDTFMDAMEGALGFSQAPDDDGE